MRVLVIGGSGFIGRPLTRTLLAHGHAVTVFAADPPPGGALAAGVRWVAGDRHDGSAAAALRGEPADAVVDLIAYDAHHITPIAAAFAGRVDRYVMLSTIAVYTALTADPAGEADAVTVTAAGDSYSAAKLRAERAAHAAGVSAVVLRAAPVYGRGDPASRENYLLRRILAGHPIVHSGPLGGHVLNLFVEDLAEAIAAALTRPGAAGATLHLAHDEPVTIDGYARRIADLAGAPPPRFVLRSPAQMSAAGLSPYAVPYSPAAPCRLDVTAAREVLGFDPTPRARALSAVVSDLLAKDPSRSPAWPGRGTTQSRLAGAHPLLHQDREQRLLSAPDGPDDPPDVDALLDALTRTGGVTLIDHDRPHGGGDLVAAPASIMERFGDRPPGSGPRRLVGVFEPAGPAALLYTQPAPGAVRDYRHGNTVATVHFLDRAAQIPPEPAPDTRFVLCPRHPDDLVPLTDGIDTLARTYLLDPDRWAALAGAPARRFETARRLLRTGLPAAVP